MSKSKPIFLFAFANDANQSLQLEEEERIIRDILAPLHDQGIIEYVSLGATSLDDIYKTFNRFHNRIALFHYSGHSDSTFLELRDKKARASYLSILMGQQKQLKLVLLNGCANAAQVNELSEKGVKSIIATSSKVLDSNAVALSRYFYQAFANQKSIKEAFDAAVARITNDNMNLDISYRGIGFPSKKEEKFPWGLYTKEEKFVKWKIPFSNKDTPSVNYILDVNFTKKVKKLLNHRLLELIYEGLAEYNTDIKDQLQAYQKNKDVQWIPQFREGVLKSYPLIVSIQLRDLFVEEALNSARSRVLELNEAYLALGKYLAIICLSNIWDVALNKETLQANPDFLIREEYKVDIRQYLNTIIYPDSKDRVDYVWLIATISRIMDDNQKSPFIEEFKALYESLNGVDALYDAYRFMEQNIRSCIFPSTIDESELVDLCQKAEEHLGVLYQKCAFLMTYQLVTINQINIKNHRKTLQASFVHTKTILQGSDTVYFDDTSAEKYSFASNQSVVVTKNFNASSSFLHLSPFVIDLNVFEEDDKKVTAELVFFCGYAQARDEYEEPLEQTFLCYERAETPGEVKILISDREDKKLILHYIEHEVEDDKYQKYKRTFEAYTINASDLQLLWDLFDALKKDLRLS